MENFPDVLAPMAEDRRRMLAILDLLDASTEAVVRADLAVELVGVSARYEDVKDRAVYPVIASHVIDPAPLVRAEINQEAVRTALSDIRRRTHHVKPAYVHVSDPNGFELALAELVARIREHIDYEDNIVFPALHRLDSAEREQLRDVVADAVTHASSSPSPPRGALGRAIMNIAEKLDHLVDHDESDPWHPGIDKLEATLEQ